MCNWPKPDGDTFLEDDGPQQRGIEDRGTWDDDEDDGGEPYPDEDPDDGVERDYDEDYDYEYDYDRYDAYED